MKHSKVLISVVGPTAVGKTAMAIELAKHFDTEIISADSRQFYREMSIGTAKPSQEELAKIKHHFIDSHAVSEIYSAGDFERDALVLLESLFIWHDVVVMVGGSGLFIKAVTEGLDNLPKAPENIRNQLNEALANEGLASLQKRLLAIDPNHYAQTDYQNPQRVVRALEVYEATGNPISYYQQRQVAERPFRVVTIGLNTERSLLYDRINQRVDMMMKQGLLLEVQSLVAYRKLPALLTVGYAELFAYMDGDFTLDEAVDRIQQNSRRYAKRQITWFKKYGDTAWFEPDGFDDVIRWLKSRMES